MYVTYNVHLQCLWNSDVTSKLPGCQPVSLLRNDFLTGVFMFFIEETLKKSGLISIDLFYSAGFTTSNSHQRF